MLRVYLAGPITGCSFDECTDWRSTFEFLLTNSKPLRAVECLSPMRGKDYLRDEEVIEGSYEGTVLSCNRGIMTRDRFDATRCNVLVVNLLGAEKVSIGTVMEIAWADACRTPIVLIMEDGNIHDHPMISEAVGFRVESIEGAVDVTRAILNV